MATPGPVVFCTLISVLFIAFPVAVWRQHRPSRVHVKKSRMSGRLPTVRGVRPTRHEPADDDPKSKDVRSVESDEGSAGMRISCFDRFFRRSSAVALLYALMVAWSVLGAVISIMVMTVRDNDAASDNLLHLIDQAQALAFAFRILGIMVGIQARIAIVLAGIAILSVMGTYTMWYSIALFIDQDVGVSLDGFQDTVIYLLVFALKVWAVTLSIKVQKGTWDYSVMIRTALSYHCFEFVAFLLLAVKQPVFFILQSVPYSHFTECTLTGILMLVCIIYKQKPQPPQDTDENSSDDLTKELRVILSNPASFNVFASFCRDWHCEEGALFWKVHFRRGLGVPCY